MSPEARPTHAGGIVYRLGASGVPEFLLVTARRNQDDWVYPKGRIEAGETAEEAALREVMEEAGVRAAIVEVLPDVERTIVREYQRIRYYLMTLVEDRGPNEGRRSQWLPRDAAAALLVFPDSRRVLGDAVAALKRHVGQP